MPEKFITQIKSPVFLTAVVILAVAFVVSVVNLQDSPEKDQSGIKQASANSDVSSDGVSEGSNNAKENQKNVVNDSISLENALAERAIGSDDAPVVMHEYSSLSCGHCAKFHNETLARLKENYVDTGKLKIVFHDFPLNKAALYGTMISRCLPQNQYYNFIQLLFENQEQWAYSPDFESRLYQYAKLAGLSEKNIDQCLSNQELQKAITKNIQNAQQKWGIRSTPTFIFGDGGETITGAQSYAAFESKIDALLKNAE